MNEAKIKFHIIWLMGTWVNLRFKFDFLLGFMKNIYRHW